MRPKAILVSLVPDTRELEELVWSLGYDVADVVVQRRERPDPGTFLGRGKLDEAAERAFAVGAKLVAVNAALKPGQVFAMERHFRDAERKRARRQDLADDAEGRDDDAFVPLDVSDLSAATVVEGAARRAEQDALARVAERRARGHGHAAEVDPDAPLQVFDRTRVILDIFSERARSPEARLQVEYARLQYETPLVKEVIHLAKKGEHPGFLGGGRYEVNYYYMMMSRRMAKIRRELERIANEREVRRKHRRRGGFRLVSLAGYTNAGKSSLLEALASHDVRKASGEGTPFVIENRYFSTLATTTRRATSEEGTFLLTDTVGFIEDLPPWMVEAFHSTLEEIAVSDCVLLVVDASEPLREVERKVRSSLKVLGDVHARIRGERPRPIDGPVRLEAPLVVVLNKADLLARAAVEERREMLLEEGLLPAGALAVAASARTRDGLDDVFRAVATALPPPTRIEARLPAGPETESVLAWLHEVARVDVERAADVRLEADLDARDVEEATRRIASVGGRVL